MGAHFSPCGRFLAACVACSAPQFEADPVFQNLVHQDHGAATSPTRHPISAHQVMYELRIYSLEETRYTILCPLLYVLIVFLLIVYLKSFDLMFAALAQYLYHVQ